MFTSLTPFKSNNMLKSLFLISKQAGFLPQSRSYVRRVRDPGVSRRLKLFSSNFIEEDPEILDSMDSDFMNVNEAHRDFEKEETNFKQKVSSLIVGRKYFTEKGTNFLTWSEKEQIRFLYQQNPQEWTPEKLSDSFPVDPLTISKLIRNSWQPRDEKRIQRHDESVRNSWKKYKSGELEVEPILNEHLKKFAHRAFNEIAKPKVNRKLGVEIPKPSTNEFLSIITSCKKYAESEESTKAGRSEVLQLDSTDLSFPKNRSMDPEKDSYLLESKKKTTMKWLTLSEYEKQSPDIVVNKQSKAMEAPKAPEPISPLRPIRDLETNVTQLNDVDSRVFRSLEIKEKIEIPKRVWKKDQMYKVGDCFYSDDGEFLYRVPGMT